MFTVTGRAVAHLLKSGGRGIVFDGIGSTILLTLFSVVSLWLLNGLPSCLSVTAPVVRSKTALTLL